MPPTAPSTPALPPAPSPLDGSPLRRPLRGPALAVVLLALMACGALTVAVWILGTVSQAVDAGPAFYQALGRAMLLTLPALAFLRFLDRREREASWVFWSVLAWGAVVATGLALILSLLGSVATELGLAMVLGDEALGATAGGASGGLAQVVESVFIAPVVEEAVKGLALLLLVWLLADEFDNLRDGLIYGALVGLGFNLLESALYVIYDMVETGQLAFGPQLAIRFVFLGLDGHAVYSGLLGAALGWARQARGRWRLPTAAAFGLTGAIGAHMLHNSLGVLLLPGLTQAFGGTLDPADGLVQAVTPVWWLAAAVTALAVNGPAFLLLAIAVWRSGLQERRLLRAMLAQELSSGSGAVDEAELAAARAEGILRLRRAPGLAGERGRALVLAQNELAYRRHRVLLHGGDPATDGKAMAWRARIAGLRVLSPPAEADSKG
ncbi:MAG: PrsW family intramembrane metalloprotease [Anaerolineae bacterium]